jgi:hypothetical protein
MEESGFYKLEGESILFSPNQVSHKDFELKRIIKDTYSYPVQGWYWFNTLEEAETFFKTQGWVKPEE